MVDLVLDKIEAETRAKLPKTGWLRRRLDRLKTSGSYPVKRLNDLHQRAVPLPDGNTFYPVGRR